MKWKWNRFEEILEMDRNRERFYRITQTIPGSLIFTSLETIMKYWKTRESRLEKFTVIGENMRVDIYIGSYWATICQINSEGKETGWRVRLYNEVENRKRNGEETSDKRIQQKGDPRGI